MPPKVVPPAIKLKAFSCPRCGALADQRWYYLHAKPTKDGNPPFVSDKEVLARVKLHNVQDPKMRDAHARFIKEVERDTGGDVRLKSMDDGTYCSNELINMFASKCFSCSQVTVWRHKNILYPGSRYEVEPSQDLPEHIRIDFDEARSILDLSPRGATALLRLCIQKLCKHLGKPGANVNADIAALVKDGLDARVQKALDIVRVVGNEAVHPGTMDLKDDRATATKLFELVNRIAYDTITHPRELDSLFGKLPPDKTAAIEKRDGKTGAE